MKFMDASGFHKYNTSVSRMFGTLMLYLFASIRIASAGTLSLDSAIPVYDLNPRIEYFEDKSANKSISQILENPTPFQSLGKRMPNFGFTNSAYWLRFSVDNLRATGQHRLLEIAYPLLDRIDLYVFRNGILHKHSVSGDLFVLDQREVKHRNFLFQLDLKPGTSLDCYLRIATQGSMQFPLKLWLPTAFSDKLSQNSYGFGIYFGVMAIMFIHSLLLCVSLKNKHLLFYVLYIISLALFGLTVYGFAPLYLWPNWPWWSNHSLVFFLSSSCIWAISIGQWYLQTRKYFPKIYLVMRIIQILNVLMMLYSLFGNYTLSLQGALFLSFLTTTINMLASVLNIPRRPGESIKFLVLWAYLFLGSILSGLQKLGIVPNTVFTEYSTLIGLAISVLLLPLWICTRMTTLVKEKLEEQNKALSNQSRLTLAYQRFVPNELLHILQKKSILDVKMGDQTEMEMTVLFSDINSFTTITEDMSPSASFELINNYLEEMGPLVRSYNGFIDKYIGDEIMALFSNNPDDAILAAINMQRMLFEKNKHLPEGQAPISVGIGINTGTLMFGIVGETNRMEGTVISDAVNIASRLVSLSKFYHTPILISGQTLRSLKYPDSLFVRFIGQVKVRGKVNPIDIYEVFDADSEEIRIQKEASKTILEEAIKLFLENEFKSAARLFKKCQKVYSDDPVCKTYLEQIKIKMQVLATA